LGKVKKKLVGLGVNLKCEEFEKVVTDKKTKFFLSIMNDDFFGNQEVS